LEKLPENLSSKRLNFELISVRFLDEIYLEIKGNVAKYFWHFENKNDLQTWINENRRKFYQKQKIEFVITSKLSDEFVGLISIDGLGVVPEIGVWIKEGLQGNGLGKEAVLTLVNWYKGQLGEKELIKYRVEKENSASQRLALACGFNLIGEICNFEGKIFLEYQI